MSWSGLARQRRGIEQRPSDGIHAPAEMAWSGAKSVPAMGALATRRHPAPSTDDERLSEQRVGHGGQEPHLSHVVQRAQPLAQPPTMVEALLLECAPEAHHASTSLSRSALRRS